jgi:hypothetical protein
MEEPRQSFKKAYQSPILRVYGDLRMLTQSVNMKAGQNDGVSTKTGPKKTN